MLDRSANIRAAFWAVLPVGLMVLGVKVFWPTVPAEIRAVRKVTPTITQP